jgi:hypothetical protein
MDNHIGLRVKIILPKHWISVTFFAKKVWCEFQKIEIHYIRIFNWSLGEMDYHICLRIKTIHQKHYDLYTFFAKKV